CGRDNTIVVVAYW
nr:immunoglobulin heavy chain junction region [Macaca mulatta]